MSLTDDLKKEISAVPEGSYCPNYFRALGYKSKANLSHALMRAEGISALFTLPRAFIYKNDLIAGSMYSLYERLTEQEKNMADAEVSIYPERVFITNRDHFAPDYETVLKIGIGGLLRKIELSKSEHKNEPAALDILESMSITLVALQQRIAKHAECAEKLKGEDGYDAPRLDFIKENCQSIISEPPKSFAQALQLVWMIHTCFLYEGRYAMAFGRMDRYLYPFYCRDIKKGSLTYEAATTLLANVFVKICERRFCLNADDVVNICIGGVDEHGNCSVNELSYCILHAVKNVSMPGPNLSARITPDTPDEFLDECLKVIGTGLGYPALMNDTVNTAALRRYGYEEKDILNYSMVGCIENFITGKQPPWSDGRFDTPRYLEYLFFGGEGYDKTRKGLITAPLCDITSMELFMDNFKRQLAYGVKEYVDDFNRRNIVSEPEKRTSPFLSCFCECCIERAKDINMGGSKYPSVHGAVIMGIGTVSDSLAAIEKVVFCDGEATLSELASAMKNNFDGYGELREKLIAAPKYGNNDSFADKYAVWFTDYLSDLFDGYRTYDGGGIYTAMAANVSNIYAGMTIGATPDGRLAGEPLSDAASPTYGRDTRGATAALLSLSKPNYSRCACGTVVNQKYPPSLFADGKRDKLLQLIKVYFSKGGQEIQINATSREILKDAMEHPEKYTSLVVRVSGFSALFVTLTREVQEDILRRTQKDQI